MIAFRWRLDGGAVLRTLAAAGVALGLAATSALAPQTAWGAREGEAQSETAAADDAALPALRGLSGHRALDLEGALHVLGDSDGCRGIVLVFLSPECPISNQYLPKLNRLAREFCAPDQAGGATIEFYGVIADATLDRSRLCAYQSQFAIEFPLLWDTAGTLTAEAAPTHVPEVVATRLDGAIVYRGRIDDQFAAVGKRRPQIAHDDLAEVLRAMQEGGPVSLAATEPVGCRLQTPQAPEAVDYARHVAPILYANCVECHRAGEVAPFSLLSYDDAAKRAEWIAEMVQQRRMPPWKARPGHGEFRGRRHLSDREIELLARWAREGTAAGDAAQAPRQPQFAEGWRLGTPDLVISMAQAYRVPADGPDIFRFFVIPIALDESVEVTAVEFRPGNPRVVHHAIMYLDRSGMARKRDEADPDYGYEGFITGGFSPAGTLGFWAPGYTPRHLPQGVAQDLLPGTDLALQLHYHPSGKEESDQSQVGIYLAKKPAQRRLGGLALINFDVDIPPGETQHRMEFSFTTPVDIEVLDITPHMHLIGTEMSLWATLPDGQRLPLVSVDWDFNWQEQYQYLQPLKLPRGTRLDLEALYDNSSGNAANPNVPPRRVGFGEMTTDEMCICALRTIESGSPEDRASMKRALQQSMSRQLENPKIMLQLMQLIARGDPKGGKRKIQDALLGAGEGDQPDGP